MLSVRWTHKRLILTANGSFCEHNIMLGIYFIFHFFFWHVVKPSNTIQQYYYYYNIVYDVPRGFLISAPALYYPYNSRGSYIIKLWLWCQSLAAKRLRSVWSEFAKYSRIVILLNSISSHIISIFIVHITLLQNKSKLISSHNIYQDVVNKFVSYSNFKHFFQNS